jgi:hypothetical protein
LKTNVGEENECDYDESSIQKTTRRTRIATKSTRLFPKGDAPLRCMTPKNCKSLLHWPNLALKYEIIRAKNWRIFARNAKCKIEIAYVSPRCHRRAKKRVSHLKKFGRFYSNNKPTVKALGGAGERVKIRNYPEGVLLGRAIGLSL